MSSVCVFGAGAIGGYLASKLGHAGTPVSVVVRGPHRDAIRDRGLVLRSGEEEIVTHPEVIDDPSSAGPRDYLFLTLKAHSIAPALPQLRPLIGPDTIVVAAVNGVPWWYTYALGGEHDGRRVTSVDPEGKVWEALPPNQVIGSVVYPAAEIVEPGVIVHTYGDRFSLGEPDGSRSDRAKALSQMMIAAGLKAPVRPRIRDELWVKLWGNMAFNPVSALTTQTLADLIEDDGTRSVARAMMVEGQAVAEALGVKFALDVDARIEGGKQVGRHRTSMLQDLESGRPLEIEALLGAVVEMASWVGIDTPMCAAMLALVRQRAAMRD